jgi:carboxyl-terminal processing protease
MDSEKSRSIRGKLGFIILQIAVVLLAMGVGFFGHRFILQYRGELGLLRQARDILINNTILELPAGPDLEHGMIRGMLAALEDPYTYFVSPAEHELQSNQLTGSYGGIGIRIERDIDGIWRVFPLPDSPALEAGIEDGDILTAVDGLDITPEMTDVAIIAAIRGPEGDPVSIEVAREGVLLTFRIKRQAVPIPSVTWNLVPDYPQIGLVQVQVIASSTAGEIETAFSELNAAGAQAFILDLRNNGGGLVDAGIEIARLFLQEGVILHQQFRDETVTTFEAEEAGPLSGLPLVLLVNGNTASSAEILSGALQVNQRALLVGQPTFGKTTIQYIFDLQDGSSIHITSGEWWIPGQTFPLQPDISVGDDPTGVEALRLAVEALEQGGE